jgi:hypothetical protein
MRNYLIGSFRQVFGFIARGLELEAEQRRTFESDLEELVAPHMAVLAHRRAKLLASNGPDRWCDELDAFMRTNLWPLLGDDLAFAERNRAFVALLLDVIIEREQEKERDQVAIPLVSRFDATWAN